MKPEVKIKFENEIIKHINDAYDGAISPEQMQDRIKVLVRHAYFNDQIDDDDWSYLGNFALDYSYKRQMFDFVAEVIDLASDLCISKNVSADELLNGLSEQSRNAINKYMTAKQQSDFIALIELAIKYKMSKVA